MATAFSINIAIAMLTAGHLNADANHLTLNAPFSACVASTASKSDRINEPIGPSVRIVEIAHSCSTFSEISIFSVQESLKLSPTLGRGSVTGSIAKPDTISFHFPNRGYRAQSCNGALSTILSHSCQHLFATAKIRGSARVTIPLRSRPAPISDDLIVISRFPAL